MAGIGGAVPARSIPPAGWNGTTNPGTPGVFSGGATDKLQSSSGQGSPGGSFVWSDSTLKIGLIDTGIHTRVLKDVAVVGVSVALLITGLAILAKPDLTQLAKSATAILPEVAA